MRVRIKDLPLLNINRFPIEAGHVMMFARAIGDPNPVYQDDAYAKECGFGGIIAPPTFTEAGLHFDPDYAMRPKIGEPWFGSAREPCSDPEPPDESGGTDMHAETHFDYHGSLRVGDVLSGVTRRGNTWEKHGKRSGKLVFRDTITDYRSQRGELLVSARTVGVTTERSVDQPGPTAPSTPANGPSAKATWPGRYPVKPPRASELKPGDIHSAVVVDNLLRGQILQYAGASGDFSPQHTDEVYNTKHAGYPTVFAHGMLNMGMMGRMLTDWLGDGKLTRFGVRFMSQSWPGETITAQATVNALRVENGETLVDLDLASFNQDNQPIVNGYATARIEA